MPSISTRAKRKPLLEISLTPTGETQMEVIALLREVGPPELLDQRQVSDLLGLVTAQLAVRVYRFWWHDGPRVQLRVLTSKEVADVLTAAMSRLGISHTRRREGGLYLIKIVEHDELLQQTKHGHPMGPRVAMVQRFITDFAGAKNEAEASAIIEEAKKIIEKQTRT